VKRVVLYLICTLSALALLSGCGSGGSGSSGSEPLESGRADLTLRVDFGTLNQVSHQTDATVTRIRVEVRSASTGELVAEPRDLARPTTGTVASVTFINVPLGQLLVSADFVNAAGEVLGRDSDVVSLTFGNPVFVLLSFTEAEPPDPPDPPVVTREFVVAANTEELLVFELDAVTGVLTQVFSQAFGPNSLPFSVDIRDDGAVYVTFNLLNQVVHFQLDASDGSLVTQTVLNRPVPEGGALSPDGNFYYHCEPTLGPPGSIRGYSLDPVTGVPTELPASPFPIPGSTRPQRLFVHPNGRFLYAAEFNSMMMTGVFYNFQVDSVSGNLTQIGGAVSVSSPRAFAFEVSPDENTLYVTGNSSAIDGFTINQTNGALTQISPSFPPGVDPNLAEMVVDTNRNILYVCGTSIGQIEAYNLDVTGRPTTPLAGSPYSIPSTGTLTLDRDPSGEFLIATNTGSPNGSVSVFRIASDGTLTTVAGSPFPAGIGTFDFDVVELTL
jgi:6-phosphogluconolactonase (cycloisomerase 2 family)